MFNDHTEFYEEVLINHFIKPFLIFLKLILLLIIKYIFWFINYFWTIIKNLLRSFTTLLTYKRRASFVYNFYQQITPVLTKYFEEAYLIIRENEIEILARNNIVGVGFKESETFLNALLLFKKQFIIIVGKRFYQQLIWFWGNEEEFWKYAAIWLHIRMNLELKERLTQ